VNKLDEFIYLIYIFPLAVTLHNIEEALWLPKWSGIAKRYHKPVNKNEFHFALICVTVLVYLASFLYLIFYDLEIFRYIYFGFIGMMIINAVFPHLVATIVLKRYAPGVVTGLLINIPCFSFLIVLGIDGNIISLVEVIISTVIVGGLMLILLPIFFKLGRVMTNFEQS